MGSFPGIHAVGPLRSRPLSRPYRRPSVDPASKNVKIDHFAFNVSREDFEKAQAHFKALQLDYEFQDHHYFYSIYTRDPDGHTVELTTIVVDPAEFYAP